MNIFIIAKQIIDVLYEFTIFDYGILLVSLGIFIYKFISKKIYKDIRGFVVWSDFVVLLLIVVYVIAFIRSPENSYKQFVKTLSAFAIYFLGRVCGDDLVKNKKGIAVVSYLIVYINGIYRIIEYVHEKMTGTYLPTQTWEFIASGALYFYKTDLLIGMVVAFVFIYAFAKDNWIKYVTLFAIIPLIAFSTSARMGQVILICECIFALFMEIRKRKNKKWNVSVKSVNVVFVVLTVLVTAFFIALQFSPIKQEVLEDILTDDHYKRIMEELFHSRHYIWWDAMHYFSNQDIGTRLLGIDLWSETLRNSHNDRFHCLYMKSVYSVGYVGSYLLLIFVWMLTRSIAKNKGQIKKYITIAMWIMFLLIGWSMEAFEYTQMSWFPFLFAGVMMGKEDANG